MSRVVLSIGSNLGDRLTRLQSVVDALGARVRAVSPVFETDAWGPVEQDRFLNAVVVADDPDLDAVGWLRLGQELERRGERVREVRWGPRTLDVDLVCCFESGEDGAEIVAQTAELTLPHPLAHRRAFVLAPWLAVDPDAELTAGGRRRPLTEWLAALGEAERDGVRPTALRLAGGVAGR